MVAEEVVALGAVKEGRFGVVAAVGGAFALLIFLSEVVLLKNVGLPTTGLPAVALLGCGLGGAFNLEMPTAGCDRMVKVNNEWQNKEGNQRYTIMKKV